MASAISAELEVGNIAEWYGQWRWVLSDVRDTELRSCAGCANRQLAKDWLRLDSCSMRMLRPNTYGID